MRSRTAGPHHRQDAATLGAAVTGDRIPLAEQREYRRAQREFDERLDQAMQHDGDSPASAYLEPGCRWNALLDAVSTYYSGAELDRISARDLAKYREDNMNWRVTEGLGATVAAYGAGLPVALDCPVRRIDHSGRRLSLDTAKGAIAADTAIVTLPTAALTEAGLFSPALPKKAEAAAGLPLGLADKLFLSLDSAEEFEANSRLYGRTDRTAIGSYHLRPFGQPFIECYFGGDLAWRLEADGNGAFFDFAASELAGLLGGRSTPHQDDRLAPLGRRPVRARLLLLRAAGQGGLPRGTCRAGGRSAVLRRRGLLACRFFHRAWRVRNRRRRRRRDHREAAMNLLCKRRDKSSITLCRRAALLILLLATSAGTALAQTVTVIETELVKGRCKFIADDGEVGHYALKRCPGLDGWRVYTTAGGHDVTLSFRKGKGKDIEVFSNGSIGLKLEWRGIKNKQGFKPHAAIVEFIHQGLRPAERQAGRVQSLGRDPHGAAQRLLDGGGRCGRQSGCANAGAPKAPTRTLPVPRASRTRKS